jgi:hypothetical protein
MNLRQPVKFPLLIHNEENSFRKRVESWPQLLEALEEAQAASRTETPIVSLIKLKITALTRT